MMSGASGPPLRCLIVILQETAILALVCLVDLMWTIWVVSTGTAIEGNPILRFYLERGGMTCFTAAKVLLFAGPLLGLELLRCRRPEFTRTLLRAAIVIYVLGYTVGMLQLNAPAMARAMRCISDSRDRSGCDSEPRRFALRNIAYPR
jgi:hypothetical protein